MNLTPERREAAIERMAHKMWDDDHRGPATPGYVVPPIPHDQRDPAAMNQYRDYARAALDALLSDHVVLHKDDVTEEERLWLFYPPTPERSLVSRWEPITNPKERNDG